MGQDWRVGRTPEDVEAAEKYAKEIVTTFKERHPGQVDGLLERAMINIILLEQASVPAAADVQEYLDSVLRRALN